MVVGTSGALHLTARGTGKRFAGVGAEESAGGRREEGREDAEEESGGGGGAETGGVAAPVVGDGGSIRSPVQPEGTGDGEGQKKSGSLNSEFK